LRLAGRGGHAVAELGKQRRRHAPDTAGRTGHQNLAVARLHAMPLERQHAQHRGVTRRADGHRLARRERRRQRHQPFALQAGLLRQATPAGFADTPAVVHDLVADFPIGMAALENAAGAVDAGHHRPGAHDRALVGDREPVLVVERRVGDADQHVAVGKLAFIDRLDARAEAGVGLFEKQGVEHRRLLRGWR